MSLWLSSEGWITIQTYIIMMLITCGFAFLYEKNSNRQMVNLTTGENQVRRLGGIVLLLGAFLPMYLVNALMSYVGNDYATYVIYFSRIAQRGEQDVDIAYKLINLAVSQLGLEFQWVYIVICLIAYVLLFVCIRKYTENMWLSYLLFVLFGFFFLLGLNQIRQFVSVILVCFGYQYIEKRKFFKYLICVLLAASFHFTALVVLPLYFFIHKELRVSFYMVLCAIGLPINFYFNDILVFLYSKFLPRYLQTEYASATYKLDVLYSTMIMTTLIIILTYRKKLLEHKAINVVFLNSCFLSGVLALFYTWIPEFKRFVYYLFIPAIFLIPQIFNLEKRKRVCWVILVVQVLVCLLYLIMTSSVWSVFPYKSILG